MVDKNGSDVFAVDDGAGMRVEQRSAFETAFVNESAGSLSAIFKNTDPLRTTIPAG